MSAKRIFLIAACCVLCLAAAQLGFTSADSEKMKKAKAFFEAKNYDEALSIYEEVLRSNPDSAVASFNVGLVLYNQKEFIQAIESFQTALATEDRAVEKNALSFIGNSYFNLAEEVERINETLAARSFREAADYYKRAMGLDNRDRSLMYNYELAEKRLYYLAEGTMGGTEKGMMRMSVGALIQEDQTLARARERDLKWREADEKKAGSRRKEDKARRESRRQEDRRINTKRGQTQLGEHHEQGLTPYISEAAWRREDAEREEARRMEGAEIEERRLREDAEREGKREAERTVDSRAHLSVPYGCGATYLIKR